MDNKTILVTLKKSLDAYFEKGPRSNEKLKILHGDISSDLQSRIGKKYKIFSLGHKSGKELPVLGKYMKKKLDIVVTTKDESVLVVLAVKYVMSNYSQNSNNYFESMLGETANMRSKKIPCFQIIIIPDRVPYFDKDKRIKKWEQVTAHNLDKYIELSKDSVDSSAHTPDLVFIGIIHLPDCDTDSVTDSDSYKAFYNKDDITITWSTQPHVFGPNVIFNNYESFIQKVVDYIGSVESIKSDNYEEISDDK